MEDARVAGRCNHSSCHKHIAGDSKCHMPLSRCFAFEHCRHCLVRRRGPVICREVVDYRILRTHACAGRPTYAGPLDRLAIATTDTMMSEEMGGGKEEVASCCCEFSIPRKPSGGRRHCVCSIEATHILSPSRSRTVYHRLSGAGKYARMMSTNLLQDNSSPLYRLRRGINNSSSVKRFARVARCKRIRVAEAYPAARIPGRVAARRVRKIRRWRAAIRRRYIAIAFWRRFSTVLLASSRALRNHFSFAQVGRA